jgi:hypothetical protein
MSRKTNRPDCAAQIKWSYRYFEAPNKLKSLAALKGNKWNFEMTLLPKCKIGVISISRMTAIVVEPKVGPVFI